MWDASNIKRFTVITGHYGTGKTNFAINLAMDLAAAGEPVTLVDLDIVNPYFRSSDYTQMLEDVGVRVIAPTFAGTTLDTPSLPRAISSIFDMPGRIIIDAGGDDVGATALGRYSAEIGALDYDMLYVVNAYRNLTQNVAEAVEVAREIESACKLKCTGVVNNSHLQQHTTVDTIATTNAFARDTATALALPLICTTVPVTLYDEESNQLDFEKDWENLYPIKIYVCTPWNRE